MNVVLTKVMSKNYAFQLKEFQLLFKETLSVYGYESF